MAILLESVKNFFLDKIPNHRLGRREIKPKAIWKTVWVASLALAAVAFIFGLFGVLGIEWKLTHFFIVMGGFLGWHLSFGGTFIGGMWLLVNGISFLVLTLKKCSDHRKEIFTPQVEQTEPLPPAYKMETENNYRVYTILEKEGWEDIKKNAIYSVYPNGGERYFIIKNGAENFFSFHDERRTVKLRPGNYLIVVANKIITKHDDEIDYRIFKGPFKSIPSFDNIMGR